MISPILGLVGFKFVTANEVGQGANICKLLRDRLKSIKKASLLTETGKFKEIVEFHLIGQRTEGTDHFMPQT